ncbi:putative protein 10 [Haloarcula hispanica icosahedral virus 2]|uniref:Uncharacterized protein n=1 Tax=Haloarcula hispanica icosahedral virus 2 TaxID=1154689 RepID=H9AZW6_9VIRU|nr:putative protein 10 [Haloarcula hispanica icosahedral virus 2]AFD02291.1 putative protein 10 [Haloarcula hispanica icosahedral virus 2]
MSAPEMYASSCCGAVFSPGLGPDNIVGVGGDDGRRLVLEREEREHDVTAAGATIATESHQWERVYRVSPSEARLYDAMRAGNCPACGEHVPGLRLIADGSGLGGSKHE